MESVEFLRDLAKQLPRTHPRRRRLEEIADELEGLDSLVDTYMADTRARMWNE